MSVHTLNKAQLAAVRYLDGPLLVLAGAGSGKTRVITQKIAYLLRECDYKPHQIVAITFTNKAARMMKNRLKDTLDAKEMRGLSVSTFHTLGLNILKKQGKTLGLKEGFSLFDSSDTEKLMTELSANLLSKENIYSLRQKISFYKFKNISPKLAQEMAETEEDKQAALLYEAYNRALRAYQAVDFDDLILLPSQLMQENAEIKEKIQNRISHLLVDEYQDTNKVQYEFIRSLTGATGRFTLVGDDDQSIYAWRGAEPDNILLLQKDFPTLNVIKLEQNYRSTTRILESANSLIKNNPHLFEKNLWTQSSGGELIRILIAKNEDDEAARVVDEIMSHQFKNRTEYGAYAILYRSNFQSRLFEKALRERKIPYQVSGGDSWFEKAEIKDMMAYLRIVVNPDDDRAFLRAINTPQRGIGTKTLESLSEYAAKRNISLFAACYEIGLTQVLPEKPIQKLQYFCDLINLVNDNVARSEPFSALTDLIEKIQYRLYIEEMATTPHAAENKLKTFDEFLNWLKTLLEGNEANEAMTLKEAVQRLTLLDILERNEENTVRNSVQLSTLHAAKGLEFPHVFLVGMEEGILPHQNSIDSGQVEEERRLCYVGLTRAEQTLTLLHAKTRRQHGGQTETVRSRFLDELPEIHLLSEGKAMTEEARLNQGLAHFAAFKSILSSTS